MVKKKHTSHEIMTEHVLLADYAEDGGAQEHVHADEDGGMPPPTC